MRAGGSPEFAGARTAEDVGGWSAESGHAHGGIGVHGQAQSSARRQAVQASLGKAAVQGTQPNAQQSVRRAAVKQNIQQNRAAADRQAHINAARQEVRQAYKSKGQSR